MRMSRVVRLRLEQIGQESFGDEASSCKVGNCLLR